jgi:isopentenyl-diphosphate delta-isomerase
MPRLKFIDFQLKKSTLFLVVDIVRSAFKKVCYDCQGRLLLQKRAQSKITFPSVWTNTCCSHPLHGLTPSEVCPSQAPFAPDDFRFMPRLHLAQEDGPADVLSGLTPGVKRAAVRKLEHELGIKPLPLESFKFLTRLHYWAADTVTHGPSAEWGENEIDYILFAQVRAACPLLRAPVL